jgi:acyl carrier protein
MSAAPANLEARVLELISQVSVVRPDQIQPQHRLREDLGMDSVCSMELLSMLAEEFDLDVPVEEAARITTVEGTLAMARTYLAARS